MKSTGGSLETVFGLWAAILAGRKTVVGSFLFLKLTFLWDTADIRINSKKGLIHE